MILRRSLGSLLNLRKNRCLLARTIKRLTVFWPSLKLLQMRSNYLRKRLHNLLQVSLKRSKTPLKHKKCSRVSWMALTPLWERPKKILKGLVCCDNRSCNKRMSFLWTVVSMHKPKNNLLRRCTSSLVKCKATVRVTPRTISRDTWMWPSTINRWTNNTSKVKRVSITFLERIPNLILVLLM